MNILPKKRWHVRTKANIERVKRDEANAAEEERILQKRIQLAEQEARTSLLRSRAQQKYSTISLADDIQKDDHVNFFAKLEEQGGYKPETNREHEEEKQAEQIKLEKRIGLLTYLGQSELESTGGKPWYLKSHEERIANEDKGTTEKLPKKSTIKDPLDDMKAYLKETKSAISDPLEDIRGYLNASQGKEKTKKHKKDKKRSSTVSIEELRAKRLKREREEKEKSRQLLKRHRGEVEPEVPQDDRHRGYNSQFNPHLARQNKRNAELSLNSKKCLFGTKLIRVFGHIADGNGIYPDSEKIEPIAKFPTPRSITEIIVCTDYLTRFAVTKALPTGEAKEAAKFLMEYVVLNHGAPREIITDRRRVFQSKLIEELTNQCSLSIHRFTTAYHPQTNGLTERLNKTLANMMAKYVSVEQKDWDAILPCATFAYNTAKQDTTGFTPFKLIHGREAETTVDTLFQNLHEDLQEEYSQKIASRDDETRQLARLENLKAREKDMAIYDSKLRQWITKVVGELVWIFIPIRKVGLSEKLMKRYFGPYRVTRKLSDLTFEVEPVDQPTRRRQTRNLVHVLRMKPYHDPEDQADLFK
ncbi:hypothetical protein LAZ67_6003897 [Cordylochernes scorpioides]|uniref:Integrase catalytic domain-containing protein n=1 Tax=Cordylochernes scorpioides TaxID=51811 RepID=A0ABY6KP48_9ARAC|nr:hypothetical protein LAZ67_6003897 [Cordylochernes scorpioides]